ncbi:GreA/GreB family elongation factor [Flavobacterium sp. SM2513]|uniref:GreA/GreB family elongation factor n=1 Tax=Flavobacterium sp. SM2513 TaxID=3424766 RepID=UPI003D7FCDA2
MSRGFVKEDDQEELPMVPPRADLPNGVTNYVTPNGLQALLSERDELHKEKDQLNNSDENERRIAANFITAKLQLLQERITTAKVVDLTKQPKDEVRFGALVTLQISDAKTPQQYQLVGVDEANIAQQKIAFIAPIAKLLINKKVGDQAVLHLRTKDRTFSILSISYPLL